MTNISLDALMTFLRNISGMMMMSLVLLVWACDAWKRCLSFFITKKENPNAMKIWDSDYTVNFKVISLSNFSLAWILFITESIFELLFSYTFYEMQIFLMIFKFKLRYTSLWLFYWKAEAVKVKIITRIKTIYWL